MLTDTAYEDLRLSFWPRVREFAVPPSMIETASARRRAGDWAGACAAAGVDVDLDLRSLARTRGRDLAAQVRADLRHLAPDLLRWHMPRIAPHGLLRPGLTIALTRYDAVERNGPGTRDSPGTVCLVVRTAPAWADAGQRISLALWDGSHADAGTRRHPHPRPNRRFRLDLHRHLWDARRSDELRVRSGADRPVGEAPPLAKGGEALPLVNPDVLEPVPWDPRCAVDRWAAEARILLRAEGRSTGTVAVRVGSGQRLLLDLAAAGEGAGSPGFTVAVAPTKGATAALPVLPDAATWTLPDLELIRSGSIEIGQLHPLVASALAPDHSHSPRGPSRTPGRAPALPGQPHLVECRGEQHRIGLVDGVLSPLDHDPGEIRREELLAELTGTPLPCLQTIDTAHRHPDCLTGVRERLHHGDIAGALAVVEGLLGPDALLRDGALRDELEKAARRRIVYGLFRSGLAGPGPDRVHPSLPRPPGHRSHPRHTTGR
ncbi:hypothetical protein OHB35_04480 [Streptomyces phaeochromogenes]|uniref:Uncharacterized protein n=1 Tax=Streptomyces phaeochromogenes TaxID=1923 RepID=A0ABZ1H2R9_STRPH|nr:hypothetical protein [Streptomyces phaeochromogenes]WSD12534.1 hypothetical protein OHB35_04480 [Streptomyces phaeochromogenes]